MQTPQTVLVQLLHPNSLRLLEELAQIDVIKLVIPENAALEIPQWYKEIVRQRVATATEKDFTEMSQVFEN